MGLAYACCRRGVGGSGGGGRGFEALLCVATLSPLVQGSSATLRLHMRYWHFSRPWCIPIPFFGVILQSQAKSGSSGSAQSENAGLSSLAVQGAGF